MEGVKGLPFKDQVVFGPRGGPDRRWEAGGERGWAINLPDPRLPGHPGLTGPPAPPSEAPVSDWQWAPSATAVLCSLFITIPLRRPLRLLPDDSPTAEITTPQTYWVSV